MELLFKTSFSSESMQSSFKCNFSCPNRDGTCGVGGCTFCGSLGSGEFAGDIHKDLMQQFEDGKAMMHRKWPNAGLIVILSGHIPIPMPLCMC